MQIDLRIDSNGKPYLVLLCDGQDNTANDALEYFIAQARGGGVVIQNESSLETDSRYASIRLKEAQSDD